MAGQPDNVPQSPWPELAALSSADFSRLCLTNYIAGFLFAAGLVGTIAVASTPAPTCAVETGVAAQPSALKSGRPDVKLTPERVDAGVQSAAPAPRPAPTPAPAASGRGPVPVPGSWQLPLAMIFAGGLGGALCNLRGIFVYSTGDSKLPHQKAAYFPRGLETPYYARLVIGPLAGLAALFVATIAFAAFADNAVSIPSWAEPSRSYRYIGLAFLAGFASKEFMQALKNTAEGLFGQKVAREPGNSAPTAQRPPSEQTVPQPAGGGAPQAPAGGPPV